jgi:hypothetical protein
LKQSGVPLLAPPVTFLPAGEDGASRRGRYEEHHLKGWPEGEAHGLAKCTEHPTCAVRVTYVSFPLVKKILLDGGSPYVEIG